MHIDTTVALLREGLLLANPSRIKSKNDLPGPFAEWDIIWCPDPIDTGYYPGYNNCSPWCNMNLFSVSPDLVALEEHQHPTRKVLESYGIECAMLPMRQNRTLSGCFHCVTLDLERI
jgi:glycine amidinotransferase